MSTVRIPSSNLASAPHFLAQKHFFFPERPGTARTGGPADLWHGPARKIMARKILARHGTKNLGTETYWHGMARKNIINLIWGEMFFGRQKLRDFPKIKIPLLAIHKIISHIWEDGSRKVNNDEPDLRFFHGNF